MKEDFFQTAYSNLHPHVRILVLGLAVMYIAIVVFQKALHAWPTSNRVRKKKAIEEYLGDVRFPLESKAGTPDITDKLLDNHLRELRAAGVFREATGFQCKPEKRKKLIELYQNSGDDWSWSKIKSASPYLTLQEGEIRYLVGIKDRLVDASFWFLGAASVCAMVAILFRFGSVTEPKQVSAVVAFMVVLLIAAWSSFSMMLPLGRAARLKKEQGLQNASRRAVVAAQANEGAKISR